MPRRPGPESRAGLVASCVPCLIGLAAALGCDAGTAAPEPAARTDGPPDVVLISMDTTRADHLGVYGSPLPTTPSLDALAARGIVFERAYAPMAQTLPSHATLLTGLEPRDHGALSNEYDLDASVQTLAERLRERGYRTGAAVGAVVLTAENGIARGFEHFDEPTEADGNSRPMVRRDAARVTAAALRWIDRVPADEPFLLFAHYYDPHDPHGPSDPSAYLKEQVPRALVRRQTETQRGLLEGATPFEVLVGRRHRYAVAIRYTDDQIGRLLDALAARGRLDNTLVVVTADHGESLGEHRFVGHGVHVWEEMVRIPLIVALPGGAHAGRRLDTPVQLEDVAPTILFRIDPAAAEALPGRDLLALVAADEAPDGRAIFLERPHYTEKSLRHRVGDRRYGTEYRHGELVAVVRGRHKLVREPGPARRLFDLSEDPAEREDLVARQPDTAAELEALLERWREAHRVPDPGAEMALSPERRAALVALGYLEPE